MTHTQHVARYGTRPLQRLCECGRPSLHPESWQNRECARCRELRLWWAKEDEARRVYDAQLDQ